GRLVLVEPTRLTVLTSGSTASLFDAATLGGRLVVVGTWGAILRETPRDFEVVETDLRDGLAAVTAIAEDRLIAVGDEGALVEITYQGVRILPSPSRASLRDLVAESGVMLAVGTDGTLLRGDPLAL